MRFGVYFAAQNFSGSGQSQVRYILTQRFPCTKYFLLDLGLGAGKDAAASSFAVDFASSTISEARFSA